MVTMHSLTSEFAGARQCRTTAITATNAIISNWIDRVELETHSLFHRNKPFSILSMMRADCSKARWIAFMVLVAVKRRVDRPDE